MEKIIYLERRDADDLPPDASEEERIDAAVRWINRKVQATVHFGLVQIGYYLLTRFFEGDIEQALSRNPRKHHSFRRLCRRGDLLISSTHLVNAVKLVVQEKLLADERAFQGLPVSHKIALLGLRGLFVALPQRLDGVLAPFAFEGGQQFDDAPGLAWICAGDQLFDQSRMRSILVPHRKVSE